MASLIEEADAGIMLAIDSARKLREIDPQHPLLKFSKEAFASASKDEIRTLNEEMQTRFWRRKEPRETQPGALVDAVVFGNYSIACDRAVEGKGGDIGPEGGGF